MSFYTEALGFRVVPMTTDGFAGAAFLHAPGSTNDHDIGLFEIGDSAGASTAGRSTVGLYHLAWEVDTLGELERLSQVLADRGALVGATDHGTTKSLYGRDPDGLEFEIVLDRPRRPPRRRRPRRPPPPGPSRPRAREGARRGDHSRWHLAQPVAPSTAGGT